jgi:hypothetical protein
MGEPERCFGPPKAFVSVRNQTSGRIVARVSSARESVYNFNVGPGGLSAGPVPTERVTVVLVTEEGETVIVTEIDLDADSSYELEVSEDGNEWSEKTDA